MKVASISEAKNHLSALIDGLKNGSPVLILDRGRPVARLEPVVLSDLPDDAWVAELVRKGLVTPAREKLSPEFLNEPLPRAKDGVSAVEALIEERREGR